MTMMVSLLVFTRLSRLTSKWMVPMMVLEAILLIIVHLVLSPE